jgi:hypothetical protein
LLPPGQMTEVIFREARLTLTVIPLVVIEPSELFEIVKLTVVLVLLLDPRLAVYPLVTN